MSTWTVLGLAPTGDILAIRRAYARRLKETRPDVDPIGFQRLREARTDALRQAAYLQPSVDASDASRTDATQTDATQTDAPGRDANRPRSDERDTPDDVTRLDTDRADPERIVRLDDTTADRRDHITGLDGTSGAGDTAEPDGSGLFEIGDGRIVEIGDDGPDRTQTPERIRVLDDPLDRRTDEARSADAIIEIDETVGDDTRTTERVRILDETDPQPDRRNDYQTIIELAPLDEGAADWAAAKSLGASLQTCLAPLVDGGVDTRLYESLLRQAVALPRGPRQEVEAICLNQLSGALSGRAGFDPKQAVRVGPLLATANSVFHWLEDDTLLTATVSAHEADILLLMLREPEADGPRRVLRMADAKAFFAAYATYGDLRDRLTKPGPIPPRFRLVPLVAPQLWALYHRRWLAALGFYVAASFGSLVTMGGLSKNGILPAYIAIGIAVSLMTFGGASFFGDRLLARAATRAVASADARGLFHPGGREAFLKKVHKPVGLPYLCLVVAFGASLLMIPYLGVILLIGQVFDLR